MQGETFGWGRIGLFLGAAGALHALLLGLWPPLAPAYGACVRSGGRALFGDFGGNRSVAFVALEEGLAKDTLLVIGPTDDRQRIGGTGVSTEHLAYRPAALLVALVLGGALAWRLRTRATVRALVLGLVGVHLFVALRLFVVLALSFARFQVDGRPLLDLGAVPEPVLDTAGILLWQEPTTNYVVPLLLWAVLLLPGLLRQPAAGERASEAA